MKRFYCILWLSSCLCLSALVIMQAADDDEGCRILKGMMADGFIAAGDDRNYDTIRGMNSWLLKQGQP